MHAQRFLRRHVSDQGRFGAGLPGAGRSTSTVRLVLVVIAVALVAALWHRGTVTRMTFVYMLVLVPSVVLHEVSHGAVANVLGDDTAKRAGRLTLNPIAHIDVLGTLILPALLLLSSGTAFGYAKPVPVNVARLRNPRNSSVLVSLAGPATNFAIFVFVALVWRAVVPASSVYRFVPPVSNSSPFLYQVLFAAGLANIFIGLFNLVPLPPLDGSAVVERLLPARMVPGYWRIRNYGMVIVLLFSLFIWRSAGLQRYLADVWTWLWHVVGGTFY